MKARRRLNASFLGSGRSRVRNAAGRLGLAGSKSEYDVSSWVAGFSSTAVLLKIQRAGSGCRGGVLPPGVASSAVLLNMANTNPHIE